MREGEGKGIGVGRRSEEWRGTHDALLTLIFSTRHQLPREVPHGIWNGSVSCILSSRFPFQLCNHGGREEGQGMMGRGWRGEGRGGRGRGREC